MQNVPNFIPKGRTNGDAFSFNKLKNAAIEARDCSQELIDAEERVKVLKQKLNNLYQKILPDMMDEAGVDHIGLAAEGNSPAIDFKLRPFYSAAIASKWDDRKKAEAFDYLESVGASDLIKTQITINLPKGETEMANDILKMLSEIDVMANISQTVHPQTLTAWLRELVETNNTIPSQSDLEKIGGTVGRVVKPVERKN